MSNEKLDTIPPPTTRLLLEWEDATMPGLFPELSAYALTATERQLDFWATMNHHLVLMWKAMVAMLATASQRCPVHRFLSDVAGTCDKRLGNKGRSF